MGGHESPLRDESQKLRLVFEKVVETLGFAEVGHHLVPPGLNNHVVKVIQEFVDKVLRVVSDEHQVPTHLLGYSEFRILQIDMNVLPEVVQDSRVQPEFGCKAEDLKIQLDHLFAHQDRDRGW